MPKKKNPISPAEQRRLFEAEVRKRIAAGELNPIEADAALDRILNLQAVKEAKTRKGRRPGVDSSEAPLIFRSLAGVRPRLEEVAKKMTVRR